MSGARQATLVLRPRASQIVIEGTDIAGSVQALDLHADARSVPRLQLYLSVGDLLVNAEADVRIADRDARALIALGWTPPGAGE